MVRSPVLPRLRGISQERRWNSTSGITRTQCVTLVEDLNVGIYRSTGDPRGRFVWGNTALLNILGYNTMTDLQDVPVIDVFSDPVARLELLDELHKKQFVKNRVLHLKRPEGTPISVSVTALAEFDENRNVVFINGIVQDVTHFTGINNGQPGEALQQK